MQMSGAHANWTCMLHRWQISLHFASFGEAIEGCNKFEERGITSFSLVPLERWDEKQGAYAIASGRDGAPA